MYNQQYELMLRPIERSRKVYLITPVQIASPGKRSVSENPLKKARNGSYYSFWLYLT